MESPLPGDVNIDKTNDSEVINNTTPNYSDVLPNNSDMRMENANGDNESDLHVGMEFDSLDIAEKFYKKFAKRRGFGIRIRTSRKGHRVDELISRVYVCSKEGVHETKKREVVETTDGGEIIRRHSSTSRIACPAKFRLQKLNNTQKWVVTKFSNEHNHDMVSPSSVNFLRCHNNMSVAAKSLAETFKEEGLPPGKVASIFNNGNQEFSAKDCHNHLAQLRRKKLDVGDAQAVLCYFRKKQAENSNFFYAVQCDGEGRMVNLFWVDARSRLAYEYFGDAITFDTTYQTNKYSMPFAPFVGLNHHCQSILFGCALLQDESEQTFVWLFDTWLKAMHGKAPISVITDQDLAIGAAVKKVFPTSRHRLCLWHITKKFPEKLAHIYHEKSKFKCEFGGCIHESKVEGFERKWKEIMVAYDLQNNEWLQRLWNIRELWIPIYNRNTFFAGMNTTQRSESINSFFDAFVHSATTLQEFVKQYEKAVHTRYMSEKKEDHESRSKSRVLQIRSKIEHQAALTYTRNIFNMFQDELIKSSHFSKTKIEKNGSYYRYQVSDTFKPHDSFIVFLDLLTAKSTCECQLFEFLGILCRHILAIFQSKNIFEIPSHYILPRWTKEANKGCRSLGGVVGFGESHVAATSRGAHICREMNQLASIAIDSEQAYHIIHRHLKQIYEEISTIEDGQHVEDLKNKDDANSESRNVTTEEDQHHFMPVSIGDPHISQTKGRKKDGVKESRNGRLKSGLEVALASNTTKRRTCSECGELGHNMRSCKKKKEI